MNDWERLRDACVTIIDNQFGRGDVLMDDAAKETQGLALATMREALNALAPSRTVPSVVIDERLLHAANYIATAPPDDGAHREGLRLLNDALNPSNRAKAVTLGSAKGEWPSQFLSVASAYSTSGERDGAILSEGTVAVLAGAGGAAKSSLALQLAVTAGGIDEEASRPACGGALIVQGARTMFALYEDAPHVIHHKAERLIDHMGRDDYGSAEERVHLLDLAGRPIYGTLEGVRDEPMEGWHDLWEEVDRTQSKFVIIDPVLAAYVGESNDAGPVREFLSAVTVEAVKRKAAVLLIAHSTKAARFAGDPFDPGQVGGSGHWVDGVRGAMSLTRTSEEYRLAVIKANYGPAYVSTVMEPILPPDGKSKMVIGLRQPLYGEWEQAGEQKTNGVNGTHAKQNI